MTKKITNMTKMNMTSQKKDKSVVTNDKLYEGLICLDVKLSRLIELIDKIYTIADQKDTGGTCTLKPTSNTKKA